jgi:hypothetical protein
VYGCHAAGDDSEIVEDQRTPDALPTRFREYPFRTVQIASLQRLDPRGKICLRGGGLGLG